MKKNKVYTIIHVDRDGQVKGIEFSRSRKPPKKSIFKRGRFVVLK